MAKKKNPSDPRPADIVTWAKATKRPDGKTEHQAALEKAAATGRPVEHVLRQKFVAHHVNAGVIDSSAVPPGPEDSQRQAARRRGTDGPVPTVVRTDNAGNQFRTQVGADAPTEEAREANRPTVSDSELADAADKGGGIITAIEARRREKESKASLAPAGAISGPAGRGVKGKLLPDSLRAPDTVTDAGVVRPRAAEEGDMERDIAAGRGLKTKTLSGRGAGIKVDDGTGKEITQNARTYAKRKGASKGWERYAVENVPRDSKGRVIVGGMSTVPQYGQAAPAEVPTELGAITQHAHDVYHAMHRQMGGGTTSAGTPRHAQSPDNIGNMTNAQFELFRAAETHLLTHSADLPRLPAHSPGSPVPTPGSTIPVDHMATGTTRPPTTGVVGKPKYTAIPSYGEWRQSQPDHFTEEQHQANYKAAKAASDAKGAEMDATIDARIASREQ